MFVGFLEGLDENEYKGCMFVSKDFLSNLDFFCNMRNLLRYRYWITISVILETRNEKKMFLYLKNPVVKKYKCLFPLKSQLFVVSSPKETLKNM